MTKKSVRQSIEAQTEAVVEQRVDDRPLCYAEKLELAYEAYRKTLDLDTALTLALPRLDDPDIERLRCDPELDALMRVCRARTFERLITGIEDISKISGEKAASVRFNALKELGRVLRPDKFKERVEVEGNVTYVVKKRVTQEV